MKTKTIFMIVAISIMIFTSCKKDIKDPAISGFDLAAADAVSEAVYDEEGSKRTVTFDNYYFNNIKVEG